jgi:hypothetical protein
MPRRIKSHHIAPDFFLSGLCDFDKSGDGWVLSCLEDFPEHVQVSELNVVHARRFEEG